MAELTPGLAADVERVVDEAITAHTMGSGGARVLATPALVLLLEQAALKAVAGALGAGEGTVGTHLDVRHLAATPVGMKVTARARLATVDGRKLGFEVEAFDEHEQIARGTHERFVVDMARFMARAGQKAPAAG
jgi:predicted thioesterase